MTDAPFAMSPARTGAMKRALTRLGAPGRRVVSLDFLSVSEVAGLRDFAGLQDYRLATPVIEHKGRRVSQDFEVCFPAPRTGVFDELAGLLENTVAAAAESMDTSTFDAPVELGDFAIQRYPAGSSGIGIHRDGKRYRGLVFIITLAGQSRLFTCSTREGEDRRVIDDRPGRIVILSAEGFAGREGEEARPLHGVDRVTGGRLSLGFRTAPAHPS
ncbi:MAG: hypothetical protein VX017_02810 [Pseudomonadota bacterium]|nr:hypothetical protein [Pseudomonadota bacterium]